MSGLLAGQGLPPAVPRGVRSDVGPFGWVRSDAGRARSLEVRVKSSYYPQRFMETEPGNTTAPVNTAVFVGGCWIFFDWAFSLAVGSGWAGCTAAGPWMGPPSRFTVL